MIFLIWAGALASAAVPRGMPLFETMLEERAFVIDLRACIGAPTAQDHQNARRDWPLSAGLCHRLEIEIEAQFGNNLLHVGYFYEDRLPELPRLLMRLDFPHGEMEEPIRSKDRRTYTRILNGTLTVVLLPEGREVSGIPLRFLLTREAYGEYDKYKKLSLIDLGGVRLTNGPLDGRWDMVRHLNEGILLEALYGRDPECDRLLFR